MATEFNTSTPSGVHSGSRAAAGEPRSDDSAFIMEVAKCTCVAMQEFGARACALIT